MDRPQDFNYFVEDFQKELDKIHKENPKADLYVNISSGTAGMKSALYITASFSSYKISVVQVDAPNLESKTKEEDVEFDQDLANECIRQANEKKIWAYYPSVENINYTKKKHLIIENIKQFNYKAAWTIAKTVEDFVGNTAVCLIEAAYYKSILNDTRKENALKKSGQTFDEYKHKHIETTRLVDYLLYLDLNRKRDLLLEFFRGLTPYIINVFELYIKEVLEIDIESYIEKDEYGVRRLDGDRLRKNATGEEIYNCLEDEFGEGLDLSRPLSSFILSVLIKGLSKNTDFVKWCRDLREIEKKVRNPAAHCIIFLSEKGVKKMTGKTPREIMDLCQKVLETILLDLPSNVWRTYENINKQIIKQLNNPMPTA